MAATTKARPIPDAIRKRLAQMLPLLSSDNAGECAAAAGAIGRLLKGHGLDWHDLTAAVTEPPGGAYSKPEPPPRREPPPPPDTHNLSAAEGKSLVQAILNNHHTPNDRSKPSCGGNWTALNTAACCSPTSSGSG